jgi:hypothetical protein
MGEINSQESSGSNFWTVNGNSNTTANNFLGTIDNMALRFKTNNVERLRITNNGWIGIGTTTPVAALQIKGQVVIDSINAGNLTTDNILVANPSDGRIKNSCYQLFNRCTKTYRSSSNCRANNFYYPGNNYGHQQNFTV